MFSFLFLGFHLLMCVCVCVIGSGSHMMRLRVIGRGINEEVGDGIQKKRAEETSYWKIEGPSRGRDWKIRNTC